VKLFNSYLLCSLSC